MFHVAIFTAAAIAEARRVPDLGSARREVMRSAPMRGYRLRVAILLACIAAPASASSELSDDFESGQLFASDGGAWDGYGYVRTGMTLAANASATHRGNLGLRVTDTDPSTDAGPGTYLTRAFSAPASGAIYLRFWVRVAPDSTSGNGTFFLSGLFDGIGLSAASGVVSLIVDGFDGTNTYYRYNAGAMTPSDWHLIEATSAGLGTTGTAQLRIDGQTVLWSPTINRSGTSPGNVWFGVSWADRYDFTGLIDFDDLRVSASPLASAFSISGPLAGMQVGDCVPLALQLLDFDGGVAPAPYPFLAALQSDGGTFHGDVQCASVTAMTSATFTAGAAQSMAVWFRPTAAGQVALGVQYTDFLPAAATVTVAPRDAGAAGGDAGEDAGATLDAGLGDAGAGDSGQADAGARDAGSDGGDSAGAPDAGWPPVSRTVGCACGTPGDLLPLALLAALAASRRRWPSVRRRGS
jgi:hypothetical protein